MPGTRIKQRIYIQANFFNWNMNYFNLMEKYGFEPCIEKPRSTWDLLIFFVGKRSISPNARPTPTRIDESDGVSHRVRPAASLFFFLAVQARKLSLSGSLGWAEEALNCHAQNSGGGASMEV